MAGARFILFLTLVLGWSALASAQDIAQLQGKVDAQLAEIASLQAALKDRQREATRFETELARQRASTDEMEQRKAQALDAMKAQFQRVIDDPSLDLSSTQTGYRDALQALQSHRDAIDATQADIAATLEQIKRIEAGAKTAERQLAELRGGFDLARADRLYRELNVEGDVQFENAISCKPDETISECMQRGSETALQEARRRFDDRIYASVSEADVVARHRGDATSAPVIVDSKITNSGFRGQGDYFVALEARLRNQASPADACALLGLGPAQCSGEALTSASATGPSPNEPAPLAAPSSNSNAQAILAGEDAAADPAAATVAEGNHLLTVRSNVFYDEVFIDGVSYGSTRLDVVLPEGSYDVEVRKAGHDSFQQRVRLDRNQTISASLSEQSN